MFSSAPGKVQCAVLIAPYGPQRATRLTVRNQNGQLPAASLDRPHGIKYRLWAGYAGNTLVRYDNEAGKDDHKHVGAIEMSYLWQGLEKLVADFIADVEALK
jgi:hypothetical protein